MESLGDYEFSLHNIYELKIQMNKNLIKGIEETIIAKFDGLSRKYHYLDETSKNIHYYNGWKSNKGYYVNKKVIVPLQAWSSWGSCLYYPATSYLLDLEKCFNYLDGGLTESIDLKETLEIAEREGQTRNIVLKYFKVTFYKKGTCHITFTNEDLLKEFNIFAGKYKNWLPPSYGKKAYNDMSEGENRLSMSLRVRTHINGLLKIRIISYLTQVICV